MRKKIAFAVAGLLLLASPLVASAQVTLPTIPANASIEQLEALIVQLTQILAQLLAAHTNSNATLSVSPASGAAPLTVTYGPIYGPASDIGNFSIDNGDGTGLIPVTATKLSGGRICMSDFYEDSNHQVCQPFSQPLTHTFTTPGVYTVKLEYGSCPHGTSWNSCTRQTIDTATVTVSGATSSPATSGLVVTAGTQPSNSLAPEGAIVPFTNVTFSNTSNQEVTVTDVTVQLAAVNTAVPGLAFRGVDLMDSNYVSYGGAETNDPGGVNLFDSANQLIIHTNISLAPGETKTLSVDGEMSSNLAAYANDVVKIAVIGVSVAQSDNVATPFPFPITGAQNTINSSLNVCYPQQTATYGYHCWGVSTPQANLTATPASGTQPLTVNFSGSIWGMGYTLDFGDGSQPVHMVTNIECEIGHPGCAADYVSQISQTHTYTNSGTFTATVTNGGTASSSATITVTASSTPPNPNNPSDSQIETDLSGIASALEQYYAAHGTYVVQGGGYYGYGDGYAAYEDSGADYKTSVTRVLYNDGYLSNIFLNTTPNYMLYTCDNGQEYALSATLANPSAADIANIQSSCNGTGANGTYTIYKKNYAVTGSHACKVTSIYAEPAPGMATADNLFMTVENMPLNANVTGITGADTWNSLTFHVQDRTGTIATLEADQTVGFTGVSYIMDRQSAIHPDSINGTPITCESESGSVSESKDATANLANVLTAIQSILDGMRSVVNGL